MARVAPEKAVFRPALPSLSPAGLHPEKTMKMTYAEQLRHPNWQRKRLERLELAEWKCEACENAQQTLHVHHKRYVKGRMAWEYELEELAVLCEACHAEQHAAETLLDRMLASSNAFDQGEATRLAIGLVAGYLSASYSLDLELEQEARELGGVYVDCGIVANVVSTADWYEVAEVLKRLTVEPRGPVVETLIERKAHASRHGFRQKARD